MLRRIESPEDHMHDMMTYDLGNGRYARFYARDVREYGLAALLENEGVTMPTERVPVIRKGKRIGTFPADFDPQTARSTSFMYDIRPYDFRRTDDGWIASNTLGADDVDCVAGFIRECQG